MKLLIYDPFAGISGDMHFGAMADLGVSEDFFRKTLEALRIDGWGITFSKEARKGIIGTRVLVSAEEEKKSRHLKDIKKIINDARIDEHIKNRATAIFTVLAEAEAKVHGKSIHEIHFHEVGAVDAIIDIVSAAAAIEYLRPDRILSYPVELGGGLVSCSHGIMPVPAPATAELVRKMPVTTGRVNYEATTPTGAAILKAVVDEFCQQGKYQMRNVGYGVGGRDGPLPNVLRAYVAEEISSETDSEEIKAVIIECTIDDMNPEMYDYILSRLFEAGAKDAYFVPVHMKKNRPGILLTVMADENTERALKEILFTESTTAGLRTYAVDQTKLHRKIETVSTSYGDVRIKRLYSGGRCISKKPEYDDVKELARRHGIPLRQIYERIMDDQDTKDTSSAGFSS